MEVIIPQMIVSLCYHNQFGRLMYLFTVLSKILTHACLKKNKHKNVSISATKRHT